MKIIIGTSWALLIVYGLLLAISVLTLNSSGTDAASRGLGTVYIFVGFILLVLLTGVNFLPFRLTHIAVFVLVLLPVGVGLLQFTSQLNTSRQIHQAGAGRFNGTYYFHDPVRQQLAQAITDQDVAKLQTLLQQPVPQLNESGTDHITLFDFAALKGVASDSIQWVIPCLSLLLAKGATIETADTLHTPTHALVSRECSALLLEWFLTNGGNPNANRLQECPTPILFTVMDYDRERQEKITLLLAHGADPNSIYPSAATGWLAGHSALLAATRLELWEICQLLLSKGADATVEGPQHQRFTDMIKRQAEIYAEPNETPASFTALLTTLSNGKLDGPEHD